MASIYLHIPFCERKCHYCDFYSVENTSLMDRFVDALLDEIVMYASLGTTAGFDTIYLGGGTPSLLPVRSVERILDRLRTTFAISDRCEVTMEVNPGTVSKENLKGYGALGVNRLSIGVQSFDDEELKFLTRIHTAREARQAINAARSAGLSNLSLDLICALPGQTVDHWEQNLVHALQFEPEHLSAYSLVVEEGTPLAQLVQSGQVIPAHEDQEAAMLEFTMRFLADRGFDHYEVSNYARPGYKSRHNSNYWSHRGYLGFGPAAHSFWTRGTNDPAARWQNVSDLGEYVDRVGSGNLPVLSEEVVSEATSGEG